MGLSLLLVGFSASSSGAARAAARAVIVKSRHSALAPSGYHAADKRLIEYGWDSPDVTYLSQHLPEMQDSPFDGVGFTIGTRMRAFDDREWSADELQFPLLRGLQWGNLDDSFLALHGPGLTTMNWYDDAHWQTILRNMHLVSQAVVASRARGLIFDPEFYLSNRERSPWVYDPSTYPGHSPDELRAKARERGRQFVEALQSSVPKLRFLTFFAASHYCGKTVPQDDRYYLLIPFIKGMMQAGGDRFQLLDGHESSYYNRTPGDYISDYAAVHACSALDLDLLRSAGQHLLSHWNTDVGMAPGIYMDYVMGTRPQYPRLFGYEQRLRWLKSNVYWALESADKYAWFYSEGADWWQGDGKPSGVLGVPPGVEAVLNEDRRLVREGRPLGYDISWSGSVALLNVDITGPRVSDSRAFLKTRRTRLVPSSSFKVRVRGNGDASRVKLFVDSSPAAMDVRPPFRFRFPSGLPRGQHDLLVQAMTSQGRTTSGPLRLRVRRHH